MFDIITDREELKIFSIKNNIEKFELLDDKVIVLTKDGFSYTFDEKKFMRVMEIVDEGK